MSDLDNAVVCKYGNVQKLPMIVELIKQGYGLFTVQCDVLGQLENWFCCKYGNLQKLQMKVELRTWRYGLFTVKCDVLGQLKS